MTANEALTPIVRQIMAELQTTLRAELVAQGHSLSGNLERSIDYEIETSADGVNGTMFLEDYGIFVNVGVSAQNIPYDPATRGQGGTSQYIQGLISFWEQRGLTGREAISAAFATAKVHAREGMPTRASGRFSETGERTGFVQRAIEKDLPRIGSILESEFAEKLEIVFADVFRQENIVISV